MRWRIPGFLNGNLPQEMMEEVREHLDLCPDCAVVLAHPARVEAADSVNSSHLRADFTEELLERLPTSFTGQKLAAFVAVAFVASGVFGVAIWAGIKRLFGASHEFVDATAAISAAENSGILRSLLSTSTVQYLALGVLAVVICLVVIAIVDRPRDTGQSTNRAL
jgi:anti-sigma factor RsiW